MLVLVLLLLAFGVFRHESEMQRHALCCECRHPPGNEIYRFVIRAKCGCMTLNKKYGKIYEIHGQNRNLHREGK